MSVGSCECFGSVGYFRMLCVRRFLCMLCVHRHQEACKMPERKEGPRVVAYVVLNCP